MKLQEILDKIDIYNNLENGWDGYSAVTLSDNTTKISKKLISLLDSKYLDLIDVDGCYPSTHSTLCIDFEDNNDNELCLEIGKAECSYFLVHTGKAGKFVDKLDILTDINIALKQIESDLLFTFKI